MTTMSEQSITQSTPPIAPPSGTTLLNVEFRKMVDTRAGRALLICVVGLALAIAIGQGFVERDGELVMSDFIQGPIQASGMIAPVIALMAMTGEFTQRTALTTFTLTPRRVRVIAAKFIAAMTLTMGAIAAALVAAMSTALVIGAASGESINSDGLEQTLRGTVVVCLLMAVMGSAVGALVAQTAIAVAVLLAAPAMLSILGSAVLRDGAAWFDVLQAFERISSSDPLHDWYQSLTAITLWVLIPAGVGILRLLRREIK
ncbi:hypothetical protein [Cumulibacter soli]|uniref:hypothetical protein n=1 Tax=Cumulibacter soli TaxID=2546344 RepID=UPI001067E84A|nr:hypothetical protein [Cumulibacter soli]